ncbi:hypothetical protein [Mesorhizobium sp. YM1C-6-2]|uniref:hypothetical protein n=1 Tax=Mesorhizobium sp. YM1C-6-2 TaxID=1827501 RepID=UPI000EF1CE41|nr:hypothetical protein [Mesorhizobium sp. YM1C-6-2]RLP22262.1 hypothetical protein D8676_25315 [Mesorhizobium sp. YM1C-6-2]
MPIRVIAPPAPLLVPSDVPGDHAADDPAVEAMIAAATALIDGPTGWLGRCFGPQTLEFSVADWCGIEKLPYGPVIDVEAISYINAGGAEVFLDDADWTRHGDYLYFATTFGRPATVKQAYPIKIQYEAGYNDGELSSGGTGPVPVQVEQAIIEGVQQLILARSETLGLRSVETVGVETITYLDADKVSGIMRKAASGLVFGLWEPVV